MSLARSLAGPLSRWPFSLLVCAALAAAVIFPALGAPGLWEPHERQLADRVAPPLAAVRATPPTTPPRPITPTPPTEADACLRAVPPDAAARSLTARAITWGRDHVADSDGGRRLPLALLGLVMVLAAAGTAMRLAGARAGLVTSIILLAMPLAALQSRMLTSEIGTACGAALIVYGLVALGRPARGADVPLALTALDLVTAAAALAAGALIAFLGGGALVGWVAPIGAAAAAGSFGAPLVGARRRGEPMLSHLVALGAGIAAIGVLAAIAHQIYDLKPLYPGLTPPPAREVLGRAVIPTGCYAWLLGGIWRPEDDLRMSFDSTFEQIAYGTFPWGLLAPLAMAALLASDDARRRQLGALTLAWAGAAWIAGELLQRKVGFTVFAGFPALAIAVGAWLDGMIESAAHGRPPLSPIAARLLALFAVLGVLDLGKDQQSFAERLTSILVGNDAVPYPTQARFLWLPTKLWVLILGAIIAGSLATALWGWRAGDAPVDVARRRLGTRAALAALAATLALAVYWPAAWQRQLSAHLSSKAMFETVHALGQPGDELLVLGDLGQASFAYTAAPPKPVADRTQILTALAGPSRVFAIAPQSELCSLHRELAGKPYYVIDDRNQRSLLLSNRVDGATDLNPLRTSILHEEPKDIRVRPKGRVVWDSRIELLGWDVPASVPRGARFEVTVYYKILAPVGGAWKALTHVDGPAGRAGNGDHEPIGGRCPTSSWQTGDYIVDRFKTAAGSAAFPGGDYEVWFGFFTGAAPNWRNMPISEAPGDLRDTADRVRITTIRLE